MKRVLIALCALLALAACTKEINPLESVDNGALQTIQVSVAPFGEQQTKTAVSFGGGFTWSAGDQIGIYPVNSTLGAGQTSQQIVFKINDAGDASAATFTGTGWGLVLGGGYKYFSYYPYTADTKYNEAAVEFKNNLNQVSNDSTSTTTAHLVVNDYLVAPQIEPTAASSCSFKFGHLGVLVRFRLTVPDTCDTKKFVRMEVIAEDSIFALSGSYDPSTATLVSDNVVAPAIAAKSLTNKLKLSFDDMKGVTPNDACQINAYFLIAPVAVAGKTLTVKIFDEDNKVYTAEKTPENNLNSGEFKTYNVTVKQKSTVAVDLSVGGETANCYIVKEYGKYKFPANVKGNGWDPLDTLNHNANAAIDLTGCTAQVTWETVNTVNKPAVGTVVRNAEIEGNYVVFEATGIDGNALISVKKGDTILWSWHIWSTNDDIKEETYPNGGGVMMDRNLGALSATPGDGWSLGFLYQWGRPFPFIGGGRSATGGFADAKLGTTGSWTHGVTSSTDGTLAGSAAKPTHLLRESSTNYINGTANVSDNWVWMDTLAVNPPLWGRTKTMYDPCPIGWRVPDGGNDGFFKTIGWGDLTLGSAQGGYLFKPNGAYWPKCGYVAWGYAYNDLGNASFYYTTRVGCVAYCGTSERYYSPTFGFSVRAHEDN